MVEIISVEPCADFKDFQQNLGRHYHSASRFFDKQSDIHVIDSSTSQTIFILRKNIIPAEMLKTTVHDYLPIIKKMTSTSRGLAAGIVHNKKTESRSKSNAVHSTIVGYIDSPNNKYPCRLTQFSNKHFSVYHNSMDFIHLVDDTFKNTLPIKYKNQRAYADNTKYSIKDTAFTTITVNYNFQTALHIDKGDYADGFGVIVVSSNNIEGGYLLFPRFDIGVVMSEGDILFMNVHEYHCNSTIGYLSDDAYRMSYVFYLRTRLLDCSQNEILNELGIDEGKHWDTSILISKILEKINVSPTKELSPKTWTVETDLYIFLCKNRQYKLYDKIAKTHTINLHNIWNYLKVTANL